MPVKNGALAMIAAGREDEADVSKEGSVAGEAYEDMMYEIWDVRSHSHPYVLMYSSNTGILSMQAVLV